MNKLDVSKIKTMHLAPYIQLATALIGKPRLSGGNMFRHQMDTLAILIDYGYLDPVMLKAAIIHDLVEDIPDYDRDEILNVDADGPNVYSLVLEVTRRPVETKEDFLVRIFRFGSDEAKVLKSADRISNMISLGYVTDMEFVQRYIEETEKYIYPIAECVDEKMLAELRQLVASRRAGIQGHRAKKMK